MLTTVSFLLLRTSVTLYPEYNRRETVDPVHRKACKQYLMDHWNGEVFEGYEADDALAWSQT